MKKIPAHIAWPAFVVFLLLIGIGSAFAALWASRSDGGAQILDNYYRQAVNWDAMAEKKAAVGRLGWKIDVVVAHSGAHAGLREVTVRIVDRNGLPLDSVSGEIQALRPQKAQVVARVPLAPLEDHPGVFIQQLPVSETGLWDFEISGRRDTTTFIVSKRIEVR